MGSDLLGMMLPGGIALLVIMFFISRRRRRYRKREKSTAAWLEETRQRVKSWNEGETAAFEDYKARLERQRALIERYNREHGKG